ncbi:hypothetical protein [Marinagarivorans algicola]|uniref:hypothetical protein n=1 Tax=Marinagarivorans algicola TaxID=1513270 RepID=UPI0006B9A0B7|nr:hypothetical protein [Marinagarivorans algicola]
MSDLIPSKADWEAPSDRDGKHAFEQFYGKSTLQAEALFKDNITMRSSDLEFMARKPFIFYFKALLIFFRKAEFDLMMSSGADTASCILSVVRSKLNSSPEVILEIEDDITPTLSSISSSQDSLGANPRIYGDFNEQASQLLSQIRHRARSIGSE